MPPEITLRHTFYRTCIVIGTFIGAYLLYQMLSLVVVLFAAIIFASAIRPLVDGLVRFKIPKSLAIIVIYLAVIGIFFALITLAAPPLVELSMGVLSGDSLADEVNATLRQLNIFLIQKFSVFTSFTRLPPQFVEMLESADEMAIENAWPFAQSAFNIVTQIFLAFLMAYYWLTAREQILELLLKISPLHSRTRVEEIWLEVEVTIGAYIRGQLFLSAIIFVFSYLGLWLFGVPNAFALALISALFEFIPMVGPFLGAIPPILVAFSVAPLTGLFVMGWYLIMQQIEGNILVPRVMEKSVGLNPLVVIIALIAGGTLAGVIGALLALPLAGALQVFVRSLVIDPALKSNAYETEDGGLLLKAEEQPQILTPSDIT